MKKLISIILITTSINSLGQTLGLNNETRLLTFEEVIKADSMKADDIYNKVKEWAILTFKNSEKVIVGDNKPTLVKATYIQKSVIGISLFEYYSTMTIRIKDGAIKVTIDDMRLINGVYEKMEPTIYKDDGTIKSGKTKLFEDIETKCKALTKDLSNFITKKSEW